MISRNCCAVAFATMALSLGMAPAAYTQEVGRISVSLRAPAALEEVPKLVSVIQDGVVVRQQETLRGRGLDGLPPGLYDVRAEGAGMITEVKRGVHVFGGQNLELIFALQAGQGVHIVEYATGGLSREEIAARLARLDSAVAALQRAVQARN